jgi:hypothetical protein
MNSCSRRQAATQCDAKVVAEGVAQRSGLGHAPEAADRNVLFVEELVDKVDGQEDSACVARTGGNERIVHEREDGYSAAR